MFHKTGPLWKQMPISRAILCTSFGVPSNGALPLGSPNKAPTETDAHFQSHTLHILRGPQ